MSLIVRHKGTGQYLHAKGAWTPELDNAMQFNSGLRLVDFLEHSGGVHEKPDQIEVIILAARDAALREFGQYKATQ